MTAVSSVSSCMHWIRGCIIILLLTILDQGSKSLVLAQLKDQPDISLIPGVLQLRYLENRGMAFGLFEGKIPVFVILCLLFFGVFIYVYARIPKNRYYLPLSVAFSISDKTQGKKKPASCIFLIQLPFSVQINHRLLPHFCQAPLHHW